MRSINGWKRGQNLLQQSKKNLTQKGKQPQESDFFKQKQVPLLSLGFWGTEVHPELSLGFWDHKCFEG